MVNLHSQPPTRSRIRSQKVTVRVAVNRDAAAEEPRRAVKPKSTEINKGKKKDHKVGKKPSKRTN
jgi:hypothetical protein